MTAVIIYKILTVLLSWSLLFISLGSYARMQRPFRLSVWNLLLTLLETSSEWCAEFVWKGLLILVGWLIGSRTFPAGLDQVRRRWMGMLDASVGCDSWISAVLSRSVQRKAFPCAQPTISQFSWSFRKVTRWPRQTARSINSRSCPPPWSNVLTNPTSRLFTGGTFSISQRGLTGTGMVFPDKLPRSRGSTVKFETSLTQRIHEIEELQSEIKRVQWRNFLDIAERIDRHRKVFENKFSKIEELQLSVPKNVLESGTGSHLFLDKRWNELRGSLDNLTRHQDEV